MMSGFQFPPPPPPPPRPSTDSNGGTRGQHVGQDRGRGRPRGRGNYGSRGRGDRVSNQYQRHGGHHSMHDSTNIANENSGPDTYRGPPPFSALNDSTTVSNFPLGVLPPGSHINPSFMTNFSQSNTSLPIERSYSPDTHIPRDTVGHKRKLESLRGSNHGRKRPGPSAAPSVPSFGVGVTPGRMSMSASPSPSVPRYTSSNRPHKGLGLTPRTEDPQYSSSESDGDGDDADEEVMYAELGTTLTFEHNGTVVSLNSAADLAMWVNDRRKNWLTKERMATKLEEKRQAGENRKRLISDAISVLSSRSAQTTVKEGFHHKSVDRRGVTASKGNGTLFAQTDKRNDLPTTEQLQVTLSGAENKSTQEPKADASALKTNILQESRMSGSVLMDSTASIQSQHGGPIVNNIENSNSVNDVDGIPAPTSSIGLDEGADSSSEGSDESGLPEEQGSKPQQSEERHPRPVCKYFAASGFCRDGESCRFMHGNLPPDVKAAAAAKRRQTKQHQSQRQAGPHMEKNSAQGAPNIYTLLVEKEQDSENLLALKMIRFLGDSGFFHRTENDSAIGN